MSRPATRTHRPTITDVARAAGVSTAVVSYALNDRPGVSAATRERVLRVAEEFGWRPNAAARSVRSGPRTVGLVVADRPGTVARDPAFLDFVASARRALAERDLTLTVQVVDPADDVARTYRAWWEERRFDVVLVPDPVADDARVAALVRVHAPVVVIGPSPAGDGLASVAFDEEGVAAGIMTTVAGLGHRSVACVTGPLELRGNAVRTEALSRAAAQLGVTVHHRETDASPEGAAAATYALLTGPEPPSVVVYDGPAAAVVGLDVARRCRLRVPWDVSIVSIGDSSLCRLASPPITVVPLPVPELGAAAGRAVLALLDGDEGHRSLVPVGGLVLRGSTCPFATSPA